MITSTGEPITHRDLILQLLGAVLLPLKVAVCKCTAHTTGTDPVSVGNRRVDEEAKRAAQLPFTDMHLEQDITQLDHAILKNMQQNAPTAEKKLWLKHGATKSTDDVYV